MSVKSILATVGKTAFPFIATAATAGNPLLGLVANFVGTKLGVAKVEPTPEGIDAAINLAGEKDPDVLLKLQQADVEFKEYMAKLGFDNIEKMEAMHTADVANARAREIAVKDRTPQYLAYVDGVAFLSAFVVLLLVQVPPAIHDLLLIMVTTLGNSVITERGYYFGSSKSTASKDETIATVATAK